MTTRFARMLLLSSIVLVSSGCAVRVSPLPVATLRIETRAVPISKDDCKRGGWRELRTEEYGAFSNQGECVSYVARN